MTRSLSLLVLLALIGVSLSQPCVTVYSEAGQKGSNQKLCENDNGNLAAAWNKQISSITVPKSTFVTLFTLTDFGGQSLQLAPGNYDLKAAWNKAISSVVVYRSAAPQFYGDLRLTNRLFSKTSSADISSKNDNKVSAIFVPENFLVQVYQDRNFQGSTLNLVPGVWIASSDWDNTISSVKIVTTNGCPVFFVDNRFQGDYFIQCESGNVPRNYNDKVSSIYIPEGFLLKLWTDNENNGANLNASPGDWEANDFGWQDRISSVQITRNGCPIFFTEFNSQGEYFLLCLSAGVPDSYNDRVSSIHVPKGYLLNLYQDYNYAGAKLAIGPGLWLPPSGWNDKLSSVDITSP